MRAVIQRVSQASLSIDGSEYSQIGNGLLVLLGIHPDDTISDIEWLVKKISLMRIFSDADDKMNNSVLDLDDPQVMVVSQFTLFASTKKGNRPSFIRSAKPDVAIPLYETFVEHMKQKVSQVRTGVFGADMKITLTNDGPVTIVIDSQSKE